MKNPKELFDKTLKTKTFQAYTNDSGGTRINDSLGFTTIRRDNITDRTIDVLDTSMSSASISTMLALNDLDNTIIACPYDRVQLSIWSLKDVSKPLHIPRNEGGCAGRYVSIAASEDKTFIACLAKEPWGNARYIDLWSLKTKKKTFLTYLPTSIFGHYEPISLAFKGNDTILVSCKDANIFVYSLLTNAWVDELGGARADILWGTKGASWFSSDRWPLLHSTFSGFFIPAIASNNSVMVAADRQKIYSYSFENKKWQKFQIPTIQGKHLYHTNFWAFSSVVLTGNKVVATIGDENLYIWSLNGKYLGTLKGHTAGVRHLKALNDEGIIISGGLDKTIRVWSLEQSKCLDSLSCKDIPFAVDGYVTENQDVCVVSGFADGSIQFEPVLNLPISSRTLKTSSIATNSTVAVDPDKKKSADTLSSTTSMSSIAASVTTATSVSPSVQTNSSVLSLPMPSVAPSPSAPSAALVFSQRINPVANHEHDAGKTKDEQAVLRKNAEAALDAYFNYLRKKDNKPRPTAATAMTQFENLTLPSYSELTPHASPNNAGNIQPQPVASTTSLTIARKNEIKN